MSFKIKLDTGLQPSQRASFVQPVASAAGARDPFLILEIHKARLLRLRDVFLKRRS
jgi:hypothetical protein